MDILDAKNITDRKKLTLSIDFWIFANQISEQVKKAFLAEGPIEGSWIEHEAVFIDQVVQEAKAYNGGIVRYEDDELVVYGFLAEASTGTLLSIEQMEGSNL